MAGVTTRKGSIHPPDSFFLRMGCGEAKAARGEEQVTYELSTNVAGGAPIVHSSKTGKWFVLSWKDILDLAREAGIDEP